MPLQGVKKVVLIGDGGAGKTCMIISHITNTFPAHYIPFDVTPLHTTVKIKSSEDTYELALEDTAGQDDYALLRPLSYLQADVFLICFRVTWSTSFENIRDKWYPEMRHYCPDVPFLIVATQIDLRDCPEVIEKLAGQNQRLVSTEEGERLAYELGAAKYVECSSLTRKGLDDVFHEALIASLDESQVYKPEPKPKQGVKCIIL